MPMIERIRSLAYTPSLNFPVSSKRIVSGTMTQEVPVTMPYKKSVHPIPVPKAPSAPYVQVWESAPMISSPGHT